MIAARCHLEEGEGGRKVAVYFLNQTFSKNKCLNYQSVKTSVSKQCGVYLEQIRNLTRFYEYTNIITLGFFDP